MNFAIYQAPELFAQLKAEWNDLLERSVTGSIFSTWEWTSTWWDVFQPGRLWVLGCRDSDDRLVGLAPWFITTGPTRIVKTIGCEEVADYLDVLVDKDWVEPVLEQFAVFLRENQAEYDEIFLCNIPEASVGSRQFPAILAQQGFSVNVVEEDVCPIVTLPGTWEEFLSGLNKKDRHELRRKLRRGQGNNVEVDWYIVTPEHDLDVEMQHFLEMMAASDPAKAAFLEDPGNVTFFKRIAAVAQEAGWLALCFLTVNGERAATYFNYDYKRHVLVYNSGLKPEFGSLSPGILLMARCIRYAIDNDYEVLDFLQGDEDYKYRLGGEDTRVMSLYAHVGEQ